MNYEEENRILSRTCSHCRGGFQVEADDQDNDHFMFCGPDCRNCQYTRIEEYWAAPCREHKEEAQIRNKPLEPQD